MTSNFNKKKINFFPNRKVIKYFIFTFFFISISIFIYNELNNRDRLYDFIDNISKKFNYQFSNVEINTLNRVNKNEVYKIINKYLYQSIFFIPLNEISDSLHKLNWVKKASLSTNFKNTIKIEITEYKPVGLYSYNNQLFYFSREAKIIDSYNENNSKNFIVFVGKNVLKEANNFLNILDKVYNKDNISIKVAYYINERRWDIKLHNGVLIYLSEKNIEESLKNYIKLINELDNLEIKTIKSIDLRNNEKAIIKLKK